MMYTIFYVKSLAVRASHRHREDTGSNPDGVLNSSFEKQQCYREKLFTVYTCTVIYHRNDVKYFITLQ